MVEAMMAASPGSFPEGEWGGAMARTYGANWLYLAAEVEGTKHRKSGHPCQDVARAEYLNKNGLLIAALSDGAGSAVHSRAGADIAVGAALRFLKRHLVGPEWTPSKCRNLGGRLFSRLLREIQERILSEATRMEASPREFAATLLAVAVRRNFFLAMQVGDGFVVTRSRGSRDYRLLFAPHKGQYANETVFATDRSAALYLQVHAEPAEVEFLCLSSDGMERLALDFDGAGIVSIGKCSPNTGPRAPQKFFRPLEESLKGAPSRAKGVLELQAFLDAPYVNRRTDDDKSMIVCKRFEFSPGSVAAARPRTVPRSHWGHGKRTRQFAATPE